MATDTVAKLLHEWSRPDRPPDNYYRLEPGITVIVDEAGMLATADLCRLIDLADHQPLATRAGRRPPPTPSRGARRHVRRTVRHRAHHRTRTHPPLQRILGSSRLTATPPRRPPARHLRAPRSASTPGSSNSTSPPSQTAGSTTTTAAKRWRSPPPPTTTSTASTGSSAPAATTAATSNLHTRVPTGDGNDACTGDIITTRRNDHILPTTANDHVRNRDHWTVTATTPQPDTQDHSLTLATTATTSRGLYVAMTRGRHTNHVYVVTDTTDPTEARDVLEHILQHDPTRHPRHRPPPPAAAGAAPASSTRT